MDKKFWRGNTQSSFRKQRNRNSWSRWDAFLYWFKKNYCWIRIAVDRYGKRFINFVIGDRGNQTAEEFWDLIKHHDMVNYWKPYESIIPKEKHIQSKAETFTVEGYNSLFRHFLARMIRKSKCYSICIKMLKLSILLLMNHRNGTLNIFD